jgi:hypothetical protein
VDAVVCNMAGSLLFLLPFLWFLFLFLFPHSPDKRS